MGKREKGGPAPVGTGCLTTLTNFFLLVARPLVPGDSLPGGLSGRGAGGSPEQRKSHSKLSALLPGDRRFLFHFKNFFHASLSCLILREQQQTHLGREGRLIQQIEHRLSYSSLYILDKINQGSIVKKD
jgi:hypothetical protein